MRKIVATLTANRPGLTGLMLVLLGGCIAVAKFFGCVGNECTNNPIWWLCLIAGIAVVLWYGRAIKEGDEP